MICPKCKFGESHVIDSRKHGDVVLRRRQCPCGYRYTTREVHDRFTDERNHTLAGLKEVQSTLDALTAKVRGLR